MKKKVIQILISLFLFVFSLVVVFENVWINNSIFILTYIIIGGEIVIKAIKNIFKGKVFDENFLMMIATIGAFIIGEFPEAVAVMLFYQVGEAFQNYAVDKSRKSIVSLMDIRPEFANVKRNNEIIKVKPEEVKVLEEIIVKPGEKIPLDGIVIDGYSMIDTSSLTGESMPREVFKDEEILSGCINKNGVLTIKVKKEFKESTVSKILNLIENASSKKSKSEKFITKFAKYYTPIVVVIAILIAFICPMIFNGVEFSDWVYRALTFLVVSCPCALVISIPLSFFGGIGGASRKGILVKGGNYLEALAKVKTVVFDKTGTLTKGVFEVQEIKGIDIDKDELIEYVAIAESYSNHPISKSIQNIYNKEFDKNRLGNVEEIAGFGIKADVDNKKVIIGNERLMVKENIEYIVCESIGTILYVAIENKYVGYILISDEIKRDSKETIEILRKKENIKTVMLTGDKKEVGRSVAKELEMDEVYTELLPNDKVSEVEKLLKTKEDNAKLVFVGDGINDAPVLAISDIGIAMGALGSDAAIEAADIVIMTDEPSKINVAIDISKKTLKIVKQNIGLAFMIKILVLILSALGMANMWQAIFADVGVSILAIINASRLLEGEK